MKIDQVIASQPLELNGKTLTKTQFMSNNQVYYTFAKVKAGDDREVETEKEYVRPDGTREITVKFKQDNAFQKGGFKADPNTMLISYAKDVVVALINNAKETKLTTDNIKDDISVLSYHFKALYEEMVDYKKPEVKNTPLQDIPMRDVDDIQPSDLPF